MSVAPQTPEQLMQTARVRYEEFVQARALMIGTKTQSAALGYCLAKNNLDAARAALSKLKLVTTE